MSLLHSSYRHVQNEYPNPKIENRLKEKMQNS